MSRIKVGILGAGGFAREVWWAHPLVWVSKLPGALPVMRKGYRWAAEHWRCHAQRCVNDQAPIRG